MKQLFIIAASVILMITSGCTKSNPKIIKMEMHLSAFGVESFGFPSVDAEIDVLTGKSKCKKWYYEPSLKDSFYSLSQKDLNEISKVLNGLDVRVLRSEYKVEITDQPTSKVIFYTVEGKYEVNDYGLEGDSSLQKLYSIVYKL